MSASNISNKTSVVLHRQYSSGNNKPVRNIDYLVGYYTDSGEKIQCEYPFGRFSENPIGYMIFDRNNNLINKVPKFKEAKAIVEQIASLH